MKAFKRFAQRFGLFKDATYNKNSLVPSDYHTGRFLPFLSNTFGGIFTHKDKQHHSKIRLIAPSKQDELGLPQGNTQNPSGFSQLHSLSQNPSNSKELATIQSTLKDCNYELLFKGEAPSNLKVVNSWSDIPMLVPVKNSLSKFLGELLSPLQKVCFPSILSGEDHVIQHDADEAARMLFLIPAFMQLLQIDESQIPPNQVQVLILAKDQDQVETVSNDIKNLQGVFSEGFQQAEQINNHVLVDTPKNILEGIKDNKINLSAVKYFVVSDLTGMSEMGLAQDIVSVNSHVAADRQVIIVSKKIREDQIVIEQLSTSFKQHIFIFSQFAMALLQDYALKASFWTIMLLLGTVGYLTFKLKQEGKQTKKTAPKK